MCLVSCLSEPNTLLCLEFDEVIKFKENNRINELIKAINYCWLLAGIFQIGMHANIGTSSKYNGAFQDELFDRGILHQIGTFF